VCVLVSVLVGSLYLVAWLGSTATAATWQWIGWVLPPLGSLTVAAGLLLFIQLVALLPGVTLPLAGTILAALFVVGILLLVVKLRWGWKLGGFAVLLAAGLAVVTWLLLPAAALWVIVAADIVLLLALYQIGVSIWLQDQLEGIDTSSTTMTSQRAIDHQRTVTLPDGTA
jgi:hypothetical protein